MPSELIRLRKAKEASLKTISSLRASTAQLNVTVTVKPQKTASSISIAKHDVKKVVADASTQTTQTGFSTQS